MNTYTVMMKLSMKAMSSIVSRASHRKLSVTALFLSRAQPAKNKCPDDNTEESGSREEPPVFL